MLLGAPGTTRSKKLLGLLASLLGARTLLKTVCFVLTDRCSFLLEALEDLQYRCTFEQLFEKAVWRLDDIRAKYMPMMDAVLAFCAE